VTNLYSATTQVSGRNGGEARMIPDCQADALRQSFRHSRGSGFPRG